MIMIIVTPVCICMFVDGNPNLQAWIDVASSNGAHPHHANSLYASYQSLSSSKSITKSSRQRLSSSNNKRTYQHHVHQHQHQSNPISNTSMTISKAKTATDCHGPSTNNKASVEHEPLAHHHHQQQPHIANGHHPRQPEATTLSPSPLTHIQPAPRPPPPIVVASQSQTSQREAPSVDANSNTNLYCDSFAEQRDATPPLPEAIESDEKSPLSDLTKLEYAIASCLDDINTFLDDYGNKSSLSYVVQKTINCRNEMVATLSVWRQYLDHPASTPKAVCLAPDDEDLLLSQREDPNILSPKPSTSLSAFAALNQGLSFDRYNYRKNGAEAPPLPCSAASSSLSLNQMRTLSSLQSLHDMYDPLKHTALKMVTDILNSSTPAPIISDECNADRNNNNNNHSNINNDSTNNLLSPLPPVLQEDKSSFDSFSSSPIDVANSQEANHRHVHSNGVLQQQQQHKETENAVLHSPIDSNNHKNTNMSNSNNVQSPLNNTANANSKLNAYAQPYNSPFLNPVANNTASGNNNVPPPGIVNFSLNQQQTVSPQHHSQQRQQQQQQQPMAQPPLPPTANNVNPTNNNNNNQQQRSAPLRSPTSPTRTYLMHYQFTPFTQNPSPAAYVEYYKNLAQYQSQQRTQSQSQTPLQQAQPPQQQPPPQLLLQQQQQQQQQAQRRSPHAMQNMLASMRPPNAPYPVFNNGTTQNRTRSALEEMMMSSPAFTPANNNNNNNNVAGSPSQTMMSAAAYAANQYMAQLAAASVNANANGNQKCYQQQQQATTLPTNSHHSQIQAVAPTPNQNQNQLKQQQMATSPLMNPLPFPNRPMVSEQKEMETDAFLAMQPRENVRFAALNMSNGDNQAKEHQKTSGNIDDEIAQDHDQDPDNDSSLYSEAKVGVHEELPDIADEPDTFSNFSSNYSSNRSNTKPQPQAQPPAPPPQLPLPPTSNPKPPALLNGHGTHTKAAASNAPTSATTAAQAQPKPANKSPPLKAPNVPNTNSKPSKPVVTGNNNNNTPKTANPSSNAKPVKSTTAKPATKKTVSWSAICKKQVAPNADHNTTTSRVKSVHHTDDEKSPELSMKDYHDVRAAFDNYRRQNGRVNTSSTTSSSHSTTTTSSSNKDRITPSPTPPQENTHNKHIAAYDRFSQMNGAGVTNHHHHHHHHHNGKNTSNGHSKQKCRVFVSNLPSTATDDQIRHAFSQCGDIANTVWFPSKTDGKFYGSGLITFTDGNGAREALRLNHQNVLGRIIRVEYSSCQDPVKIKPPGCRTIYLNNVPKDAKESGIRQIFKQCGRIKRVRFHERDTKRTGGAFIEFEHSSSCDRALELHGILFDNHPLYVDYQRY